MYNLSGQCFSGLYPIASTGCYITKTGNSPNASPYNTSHITEPESPKNQSTMKTVIQDIKSFVSEHRNIIYGLVIVILIDHFFLGNKLSQRVKSMAEKMLGSVEKKVNDLTGGAVTPAPAVTV